LLPWPVKLLSTVSVQALGRARGALADIAKRTAGPLRAQDTLGALEAQELRAVLARMEPKQRAAAISAHLLADDVFASAVLNARPLLSGLDPTEHAIHLHAWRTARHGPELERAERLSKAVVDAERGGRLAVEYVDQLTDAKLIAQAEASAQAERDALADVG
jgi:hypothetical protein